jgi:hypothetical protein
METTNCWAAELHPQWLKVTTRQQNSYQQWAAVVLQFCIIRGACLLGYCTPCHVNTKKKNTRLRHSRSTQASMIAWKHYIRIVAPLLSITKCPDYSKATNVSFGLLHMTAQHDVVQKEALIGLYSTVFATWEGSHKTMHIVAAKQCRTAVGTKQSDLMEMLSQGGFSDTSTFLSESLESKKVLLLLMALPFVYLALLNKILKGFHNNAWMEGTFSGQNF